MFKQKKWCLFHLPIEKGKSGKAEWDEAECQKFNERIFKFIEDAKENTNRADLSGVVFPGSIDFAKNVSGKNLPEILFFNAIFSGDASFNGTTFTGKADFSEATFSGKTWFIDATFLVDMSFDEATFSGDAFFNEATFGGNAYFNGATFSRFVRFTKAIFSGNAQFYGTTFSDICTWEKASFSDTAEFSGSVKEGTSSANGVVQPSANSFAKVSFRDAEFNKRVRFTNRRFLDTTDFRGGFFEVAPEFHNCTLHQDTDFSKRDFRDTKGTDSVDAVRAYRTLKLAMEQVRSRSEEAMFFALEQRSIRASKRGSRWERLLSFLYGLSSDYGRNSLRPLLCLVAVYVAFLVIYYPWFIPDQPVIGITANWTLYFTPDAKKSAEEVAWFGLEQVFSPFKVFRLTPSPYEEPVPLSLAFLGALHSVLNFSLLALFLLALRRRFKLD